MISFGVMGWQWAAPAQEFLEQAASDGRAWWWRKRQGLLAIWMESEGPETFPLIQTAACPAGELGEYLLDFRRLAGRLGFAQAGWVAPDDPILPAVLAKAGFETAWDHPLFVFEKEFS